VHAYNTLRVINIADGTNEILRRTIYQQLANLNFHTGKSDNTRPT
jgi:hypothetical protein